MNKKLELYYNTISAIDLLFDGEASIYLSDTEKFIYCKVGKDAREDFKEGQRVTKGGVIERTISSGRNNIEIIDDSQWGVKLKVYCMLIRDEHEIVGTLTVIKSLADHDLVMEMIKDLADSIKVISEGTSQIISAAKNIEDMNKELLEESDIANERAKDTYGIVNLIQGIAAQTDLLGLNASIEASRAGDFGRGFNVVAQEICKLSNSSKESINKIDSVIQEIRTSISSMSTNINKSNEVSQKQAEAICEINSSVEKLKNTVNSLERILKNI